MSTQICIIISYIFYRLLTNLIINIYFLNTLSYKILMNESTINIIELLSLTIKFYIIIYKSVRVLIFFRKKYCDMSQCIFDLANEFDTTEF